jgi:hypothetical protein
VAFPGWQLLRNRTLGTTLAFAAGGAAAAAFTPPMRDVVAELETRFGGTLRLSGPELAELVVRGALGEDAAASRALEVGYSSPHFHELFLLAGNPPGPSDLADLWNRGAIDEARFVHGIRTGRIRTEWVEPLKELRNRLFTPAEAADLSARGLLARDEAAREARAAGVSAERFASLERAAARPPAVGQLLDLVNRGRMDEGRARQALRDSGLRAEYVDDVLELRRYLLPPSDVIRLAVHEVYTPRLRQKYRLDEEFPAEFAQHGRRLGISRGDLEDLWAGHWQPPSAGQGFDMFHRDLIDRQEVAELLRVHDYVPWWRDRLIDLSYRVPGRIDIRRLFTAGVIDRAELVRGYHRLGYAPADAQRLATLAQRLKMGAERDLTKAEIIGLYEAAAMARAEAAAQLDELGYDEHEAEQILTLADARRARVRREAVSTAVRSRFLDRELTTPEARARLLAAGLPSEEVDFRLDLWSFALAESPHHITEAQMRAAWQKGIVNEDRYRRHLAQLGYPDEEADILLRLYRAPA